jgi:hypothetical protein
MRKRRAFCLFVLRVCRSLPPVVCKATFGVETQLAQTNRQYPGCLSTLEVMQIGGVLSA